MKEILIQIFWTFVAYVIILKVSINLIGLVVRGLLEKSPNIQTSSPELDSFIKNEIRKNKQLNIFATLISIILTVAYFYALYHFWNICLAITAGIIMVCRLPDLIWEIKTGKRVSKTNPSQWPFLSNVAVLIDLLCLPLTWYCLFRFS